MQKEYIIYSMQRSGHHAIIFWLIENMGGYTKKIDNCSYWNDEKELYYYNDCNHVPFQKKKKFNICLRSYEDILDLPNESANNSVKIIILRDFVNMIISRYKKFGTQLGFNNYYLQNLESIIGMWKAQAKDIINQRAIGILYNKWVIDKEYRDDISKKLGFENLDKTDYVPTMGDGSSFCGMRLEMNKDSYNQRFDKLMLPASMVAKIRLDRELAELHVKLFGKNYCDEL